MTTYKSCGLTGEKKDIFLLNALTTMNYAIFILHSCPIPTQNPTPTLCRASLGTLKNFNFLALRAQNARIRHFPLSLIVRDSKALFEGKSPDDTSYVGESKVLPHPWHRRFKGIVGFIQGDN